MYISFSFNPMHGTFIHYLDIGVILSFFADFFFKFFEEYQDRETF